MPTGKIELVTIQEFNEGFQPSYSPVYGLFLPNSQSYNEQAGQIDFRRITTVGDIRGKRITPKDSTMHAINAGPQTRHFQKYFFGAKFIQSTLQDPRGISDVVGEVLDEHNKQADEIFCMGEGTSANDVVNNGLFWSADPNYTTNSSAEVQKDGDGNYLADLHKKIMGVFTTQADLIAGDKMLLVYGSLITPLFDSLYPLSNAAFKTKLQEILGASVQIAKMPINTIASGANGFLIVNKPRSKTHYMTLPKLAAQGVNEENQYSWHNFMQGSWMLELSAKSAIIKQPLTLEA